MKSPTYSMKVVELPAVAEARARVRVPGVHRSAAAEGRSGRRRRGDRRHRSARQGDVHDADAGRRAPAGSGRKPPRSARRRTATLTGSFKIADDGYYHVELDGPRGEKRRRHRRSTRLTCIEDRAPTVTFEKPRRDTSASPVEEVFMQATRRRRLRRGEARARLLGERRRREDGRRSTARAPRRSPRSAPATRSTWKSSA